MTAVVGAATAAAAVVGSAAAAAVATAVIAAAAVVVAAVVVRRVRAPALDLGGVPGAGDALGADVDARPGAQRREGHALEPGARSHLDLQRSPLGVADGERA